MTRSRKAAGRPAAAKLSHRQQPDDMTPMEWQRALRKQFGRSQPFTLKNTGKEPFFSDFRVRNPASGGDYKVAIRGLEPGDNFCACADFATNDLGTCKHIEFVLGKLEKKRGAKKAFASGYQPRDSEIFLRYCSERSVHLLPGSRLPVALTRAAKRLFEADNAWRLPLARFDELDRFIALARRHRHPLRVHDDAVAFIRHQCEHSALVQQLRSRYRRRARDPKLAKLLQVPLLPYQAEGVWFAANAGRALIGDDMGLGKTVQAIATAELLRCEGVVQRVLVICPTSLKHQWQQEFQRFAGRDSLIVGGAPALRRSQYQSAGDCAITNYELLKSDREWIAAYAPDLIIVDEAQRIKNWNTIAARELKKLSSRFALVLTGTPLENRLEELVSIVQFVDQHRLGPTWRLLHEHQIRDQDGRVTGYRDLDRIGATLAPLLIRRRKHEVLQQLPKRSDKQLFVPLTAVQRRYHDENAEHVARIVQRWRTQKFLSEADQRRLTCALQNMRMACDDSYLLDPSAEHGHKAHEIIALLSDVLEQADTKVVIFSQWKRMHDLLARKIVARGWGHVLFHGGVPGAKRKALVERFRHDADCRVFLATDAGSTGLNLQHASVLINVDLPWNPAVLEQRIARIHRLGQQRPVQVYHFISDNSIEQGMLATLAFKRSLAAGILDGGKKEIRLQGTRLTQFIERIESVTQAASASPPAPPTDWQTLTREGDALAAAAEALTAKLQAAQGRRPEQAAAMLRKLALAMTHLQAATVAEP